MRVFWNYPIILFGAILFLIGTASAQEGAEKEYIQLIVAQPSNFTYGVAEDILWSAPVIEAVLSYKMEQIDRIQVESMKDIAKEVNSYRDFTKRQSKSSYERVAERLSSTHILWTEYEDAGDGEVELYFKVFPVANMNNAENVQITIDLNDIQGSVSKITDNLLGVFDVTTDEYPPGYLENTVTGEDRRTLKKFGKTLVEEKEFSDDICAGIAEDIEKIYSGNSDVKIAAYTAGRYYAAAGLPVKGAGVISSLERDVGDSFKSLNLIRAKYYLTAGQPSKAKSAVSSIQNVQGLKPAVVEVNGSIALLNDDVQGAREAFKELTNLIEDNPAPHIRLAEVACLEDNKEEAKKQVKEASKLSGREGGSIFSSIGERFYEQGKKDAAVSALKLSAEMKPTIEETWKLLGKIQEELGLDSAAAGSYLELFRLDYLMNREYLMKAAELYKEAGNIEEAKKAYEEMYQKQSGDFEVAMEIAKIEYDQGNCSRVRELIDKVDNTWQEKPFVKEMSRGCEPDSKPPEITLKGDNPMILTAGSEFSDPGATAYDSMDGNLTDSISVEGSVDPSKIDTFSLIYSVSDNSGNEATEMREVIVTDTGAPEITLKGDKEMEIPMNGKYVEKGATATDQLEGDISDRIQTSGSVNTSKPGSYEITYSVEDNSGNRATAVRRVSVIDTVPPKIELKGDEHMVLDGGTFEDPGVLATDNADGDISDQVQVEGKVKPEPGKYTLTYKVADAAGNQAESVTRTVEVKKQVQVKDKEDTTPPEINLSGGSPSTLEKGEDYTRPDATAVDNKDGDISERIEVMGSVDTDTPGEYGLTYTVTDNAGNRAEKNLTVNVVDESQEKEELDIDAGKEEMEEEREKSSVDLVSREADDDKPSKAYIPIAIGSGALAAGSAVYGVLMNSKLESTYEDYNNAENTPDAVSLREECEKYKLRRNIGYIGAGVFGVTFTIDIIVGSARSK